MGAADDLVEHFVDDLLGGIREAGLGRAELDALAERLALPALIELALKFLRERLLRRDLVGHLLRVEALHALNQALVALAEAECPVGDLGLDEVDAVADLGQQRFAVEVLGSVKALGDAAHLLSALALGVLRGGEELILFLQPGHVHHRSGLPLDSRRFRGLELGRDLLAHLHDALNALVELPAGRVEAVAQAGEFRVELRGVEPLQFAFENLALRHQALKRAERRLFVLGQACSDLIGTRLQAGVAEIRIRHAPTQAAALGQVGLKAVAAFVADPLDLGTDARLRHRVVCGVELPLEIVDLGDAIYVFGVRGVERRTPGAQIVNRRHARFGRELQVGHVLFQSVDGCLGALAVLCELGLNALLDVGLYERFEVRLARHHHVAVVDAAEIGQRGLDRNIFGQQAELDGLVLERVEDLGAPHLRGTSDVLVAEFVGIAVAQGVADALFELGTRELLGSGLLHLLEDVVGLGNRVAETPVEEGLVFRFCGTAGDRRAARHVLDGVERNFVDLLADEPGFGHGALAVAQHGVEARRHVHERLGQPAAGVAEVFLRRGLDSRSARRGRTPAHERRAGLGAEFAARNAVHRVVGAHGLRRLLPAKERRRAAPQEPAEDNTGPDGHSALLARAQLLRALQHKLLCAHRGAHGHRVHEGAAPD